MYELKKIGKVFTNKFVGTGPSSYEKGIYRASVSQTLRNTRLHLDGRHQDFTERWFCFLQGCVVDSYQHLAIRCYLHIHRNYIYMVTKFYMKLLSSSSSGRLAVGNTFLVFYPEDQANIFLGKRDNCAKIRGTFDVHESVHRDSFIHLVVCLTTGPKPLPKRALHIVRSRASSFK